MYLLKFFNFYFVKSIPDVSSSNKMRSPRTKFKNVDEPSPENRKNIFSLLKDIFQNIDINNVKYFLYKCRRKNKRFKTRAFFYIVCRKNNRSSTCLK